MIRNFIVCLTYLPAQAVKREATLQRFNSMKYTFCTSAKKPPYQALFYPDPLASLQSTSDPFHPDVNQVIDVRTPTEYHNDHIPGAVNLPVLSNEERHIIGKEYKENSFEARRHGASLVSKNISAIITEYFMDKRRSQSFMVYCWRGGQRSKSLAVVLSMIGYDVKHLVGGYKSYRKQIVHGLEDMCSRYRYNVIGGMTGTGKTLLLQVLANNGEQVLDFEALANHKGSVLGGNYDNDGQPPTRFFETCLYGKLASFEQSKPVWVEAESRRIGKLQIPNSVFESISRNIDNAYYLKADLQSRIDFIMNDYAFLRENADVLKEQISRLQKFGLPLKKWYKLIDDDLFEDFVRDILKIHYDPMYRKSQLRNLTKYVPSRNQIDLNLESVHERDVYKLLPVLVPRHKLKSKIYV